MINNAKVGKKIAELRQARGLTQQQLASILNLSHQAVSKWESGMALPDIQTLMDLTRFFGITVEGLLTDEEEEVESEATVEEEQQPEAEEKAAKPEGDMSFQRLAQMAPFMTKEAIEEIAMQLEDRATGGQIAKLAPFLHPECIMQLIDRHKPELSWENLRKIAPFMRREDVDALARAIASGDKTMKAKENFNKTFDDIGRAIDDIGKTVDDFGRGVGKAVKRVFKFGNEVIKDVSAAIQEHAREPQKRSEKALNIRKRAFERAVDDGRWDWVGEHIEEIRSDEDLMNHIAQKARESGMQDWICEYMSAYVDAGTVDAAIDGGNWTWLATHAWQLDAENQVKVVMAACKAKDWAWLDAHTARMQLQSCIVELAETLRREGQGALAARLAQMHAAQDQQLILAETAYNEGDMEMLERYMEILEGGFRSDMISTFANRQDWPNVQKYLRDPDPEMLEDLMEKAVEQGNFDAVDTLDSML